MMIDEKSRIAARAALTDYLKARKLRKTPERYAILDKVLDTSRHFGVETLYVEIEADGYHVSRATIYNTMELLEDCGLVRKHQFGGQPAQYECVVGIANHLHLICQQCGKIKEVKDQELVRFMNSRRYSAFNTSFFTLYVYGVCAACSRRSKRLNSAIGKETTE